MHYRLSTIKSTPPRIVPMGPPITNSSDLRTTVSNSARRLEVCFYIIKQMVMSNDNLLNYNLILYFRYYVTV